jgi:GNAT superfamily N-acetyltransferase
VTGPRPVRVRPASAADEPFLRAVYAAGRAAEVAGFGWPPAAAEAFLAQQFAAQRRAHHTAYPGLAESVIEVGGQPVGRLAVQRDGTAVLLVDIALLPAYRGRGTGTLLLRRLRDEAAAARLPLRLQVGRGNPARRLYQRLGLRASAGTDPVRIAMEWRPRQEASPDVTVRA